MKPFILVSLISMAAAIPDPVRLFETVQSPELESVASRSDVASIKNVLQDQGVALAEATFDSGLTKSKCMALELCRYGANNEMQFGPALTAFTDFLKSMKENTARDTKNIDGLLSAVQVGQALGEGACGALYECGASVTPAVARVNCATLGNICPGLAMSCTMCGIFAPAVCGPACTFAGIYCGVAGYTC